MSAKSESYEEEIPSDNSKLDNNLEKEEDENQLIEEINENYKYINQTPKKIMIVINPKTQTMKKKNPKIQTKRKITKI